VIIFSETHLRRTLAGYLAYYHHSRTHLSLAKDAPTPRRVQAITDGEVIAFPKLAASTIDTNDGPPDVHASGRAVHARTGS
jgi:hypothetical protein